MTEPSSPPAVAARDLGHAYGDRRALDGLGFEVAEGEIFGFLGPNGSGKTTLFQLLATLLPVQEGSLTVFGADVSRQPGEVRRRLGVVFQTPSVDRRLTLAENLRHQGHLYGLSGGDLAGRIAAGLERFSLADRAGERAGSLSGGLRRRLEIAKALLHRPRLLLLDEPSSGLDPGVRRELWRVLERASREEGVTVLLTTHFMEEAERCDRLALLDGGRRVAGGTPAELVGEIGGRVVTVRGDDPERLAADLAGRFAVEAAVVGDAVRFEHDAAVRLLGEVTDAFGERIREMSVARPTLEDVFLRLTGHSLDGDGGPGGAAKG